MNLSKIYKIYQNIYSSWFLYEINYAKANIIMANTKKMCLAILVMGEGAITPTTLFFFTANKAILTQKKASIIIDLIFF